MSTPNASSSEPVTIVARRLVKPGREHAYEAWLSRLLNDATGVHGYLGATIHRPAATSPREYTSVFRFDHARVVARF